MKVITLKQPYASLVAEGIKEYEFRTWKTNYRGDILIHAGKGIDKDAMEKFKDLNLEYPSGCIIAKANLSDCVFIDNKMREILKKKNYFVYSKTIDNTNFNGYGFVIKDVKKIKPIFINGKLSLWDYDYE